MIFIRSHDLEGLLTAPQETYNINNSGKSLNCHMEKKMLEFIFHYSDLLTMTVIMKSWKFVLFNLPYEMSRVLSCSDRSMSFSPGGVDRDVGVDK